MHRLAGLYTFLNPYLVYTNLTSACPLHTCWARVSRVPGISSNTPWVQPSFLLNDSASYVSCERDLFSCESDQVNPQLFKLAYVRTALIFASWVLRRTAVYYEGQAFSTITTIMTPLLKKSMTSACPYTYRRLSSSGPPRKQQRLNSMILVNSTHKVNTHNRVCNCAIAVKNQIMLRTTLPFITRYQVDLTESHVHTWTRACRTGSPSTSSNRSRPALPSAHPSPPAVCLSSATFSRSSVPS